MYKYSKNILLVMRLSKTIASEHAKITPVRTKKRTQKIVKVLKIC